MRRRPRAVDRPIQEDFSLAVPLGYIPPPSPAYRIAVIIHLFNIDLAREFVALVAHLDGADVYISTDSDEKRDRLAAAFDFKRTGATEIRVVVNRGRDIAPKFVTFAKVYPRYDLVLCVHSKKTDYNPDGAGWREKLLDALAGSPAIVASILELFALDPNLGLIFPQHHEPVRRHINWGANYPHAARLARRMKFELDPNRALDLVSGSMFWARPAALEPLLGLGIKLSDFPKEEGQIDGTIAHAIERLLLFSCEKAGLEWAKIACPDHYQDRSTIITACSREEVAGFLENHRFRLLPR